MDPGQNMYKTESGNTYRPNKPILHFTLHLFAFTKSKKTLNRGITASKFGNKNISGKKFD